LGRDFTSSFLIFTAIVNIHHFMLDGAVWKLRDSRVASLLIRTARGSASVATDVVTRATGQWNWRFAKGAALFLLLALAGLDQTRHFLASRVDSRSSLTAAASLNPYDSDIHTRLGRVYASTGETQLMERALREAVRINPGNVDAQSALARMLVESNRYDDAYAHYRQMLSQIPPDAQLLVNFGLIARHLNRVSEAVDSFELALELKNDYPPAHFHLGETLAAYGKPQEAIPHYERYIAVLSSDSGETIVDPRRLLDGWLRLAGVYAENGQLDKAIAAYETCAEMAEQGGDAELRNYALERILEIRSSTSALPAP
jgi:tetratricopeptide (TPR) repeat protein